MVVIVRIMMIIVIVIVVVVVVLLLLLLIIIITIMIMIIIAPTIPSLTGMRKSMVAQRSLRSPLKTSDRKRTPFVMVR
jgi:hypothetical protein